MTLADDIRACTRCPLHLECSSPVPAEVGSNYHEGGLAVLTETPGLSSKAQAFLDAMLTAAGTSRDQMVVLSTVRCRPADNRLDKHPEALFACNDWLVAELEAYNPKVVVLLGNTPMRKVYGQQAKITAVRGLPRQTGPAFQCGAHCFVPTFNPTYGLRNSASQAVILDDLKLAVELCSN